MAASDRGAEQVSEGMTALWETWRARRTGLSPHYPFLYFTTVGMGAQRVFEFGTGESSAVIVQALRVTDGWLHSVAPTNSPPSGYRIGYEHQTHHDMLSESIYPDLPELGPFDLVLHDGSHSAEVVAADLEAILPCVRQWGLILVHDSLHSYCGEQVRKGIESVLRYTDPSSWRTTWLGEVLTLPFGFGLTIIKVLGNAHLGTVHTRCVDKPSSPHYTEGPTK